MRNTPYLFDDNFLESEEAVDRIARVHVVGHELKSLHVCCRARMVEQSGHSAVPDKRHRGCQHVRNYFITKRLILPGIDGQGGTTQTKISHRASTAVSDGGIGKCTRPAVHQSHKVFEKGTRLQDSTLPTQNLRADAKVCGFALQREI